MTRKEYIELVKQVWPNAIQSDSYIDVNQFTFKDIGETKTGFVTESDLMFLKAKSFVITPKNNSISFHTDFNITE